jgi:DNA-binding transcriptional LysR family regulator
MQNVELAVPKGHPLSKRKRLRLRDGLKSPRIVQEAANEATILSLVSHGMGVGWVNGTVRWRCPKQVVILSITDLNMPLPMALA